MPSDIIQWFPGHMAKTRRLITENLKSVDAVIEIRDARIPYSSRNPELKRLINGKPVLILLNKAGLADERASELWKKHAEENGEHILLTDCQTGMGIQSITPELRKILKDKLERFEQKGMVGRPIRAMIVGIPNVGKSSLINKLCKGKKVKVENRPGVTLNKQWVPTSIGIDLMDMPGVLWPKFDDRTVGENLAITGAIKDAVLNIDEIAIALIKRLTEKYPNELCTRFKISKEDIETLPPNELFELIGKKRGIMVKGGEVDYERTAAVITEEMRNGKIGRITLELPSDSHVK